MTEVVILPGLDGTASLLADFCASLGGLGVPARAMAYPLDRPWGYSELEAFVRPLLPSSRPFVLVGESFSGPLALSIASCPPAGLAGLVLSTTFACAPVPALSPLASLVRFTPARPPLPLLSWVLLGPWGTREARSSLASALRQVHPDVLRARAAAALRANVGSVLPSIRVPVLQLVAKNDRMLSRSASLELAAGLPQSQVIEVEGPHLLLQASTLPCAREVAAFVRRMESGDPSP